MDQQYLDKNYGGILIVWDRLFGSFQAETTRPHYGLTKQVDTFNIWKLQTHEYVAIARDVRPRRAGATGSATSSDRPAGCLPEVDLMLTKRRKFAHKSTPDREV